MQMLGVYWKIQDICYKMGTEIFKIEEEMIEKMKPKIANPPKKMGRIHCSHYALLWNPSALLWLAMKAELVPYVNG